jgi:hypothetical protein
MERMLFTVVLVSFDGKWLRMPVSFPSTAMKAVSTLVCPIRITFSCMCPSPMSFVLFILHTTPLWMLIISSDNASIRLTVTWLR